MLKLAQEEKNYKKMVQNDLKAEDEQFKKNYEARAKASLAQKEQQIQKSLKDKLEKDESLF